MFPLDGDSDPEANNALYDAMGVPHGARCKGYYMKLGTDSPYAAYLDLLSFKPSEGDSYDEGVPYDHARHLGIFRLCMWSRDFEADVKALQDMGVEFLGEPCNQLGKMGLSQVAMFKDPDGTILELTNDWARPKEGKYAAKGIFDGGQTA